MEHSLSDRSALIGFVVVGLLVLIREQPRLLNWGRRLGIEQLLNSRLQFLIVGLLLSETGVGALNQSIVRELDALVTLGLGILGLLLGLRFAGPASKDPRIVRAAGVEGITTLLLVGGPLFFLLDMVSSLTWQQRAVAAALLGCTAAISGRRSFTRSRSEPGPWAPLNHVADLSTILGVLAAGILLAVLSPSAGVSPLERVLTMAVIGCIGGLGAWLLATDSKPGALRTALLLGVLLVTAGTATHLALPPVAATLIMGLTIANLPGSLAQELAESLAFLESPVRALLLVMAGAALPLPSSTALIGVALFLTLRTAGKILGGRMGSSFAKELLPEKMGLGLLPSSAVALGLALDFQATAPGVIAHVVVITAVLGSLFSETAGVWTTQVLARAHMLSEAALDAVSEVTSAAPQANEQTR